MKVDEVHFHQVRQENMKQDVQCIRGNATAGKVELKLDVNTIRTFQNSIEIQTYSTRKNKRKSHNSDSLKHSSNTVGYHN